MGNVGLFSEGIRIQGRIVEMALKVAVGCAFCMFVAGRPTSAQTYLSGTYNCKTVEVAGKSTPCSAPSIELKADGSYQILSERGNYEIVANRWLLLSTKKSGKARLSGSKEIIFDFVSGGRKSRITYLRKYQREAGAFAI